VCDTVRSAAEESSPHILIAEDDILCRLALAVPLSAEYNVLQAENGYEAAILSGQYRAYIAAVITDIRMPVTDGIEFIGWLRAQGSEIPVIVVSSTSDDDIRESVMKMPDVLWHPKPCDSREIRAVLRQMIGKPA
jgi:DNA-binding response OmpR family regulator